MRKSALALTIASLAVTGTAHAATWREQRMLTAARAYWTAKIGDKTCTRMDNTWICKTSPVVPQCGEPQIRKVRGVHGALVQADSWSYVTRKDVSTCTIELVARYWTSRVERTRYPVMCRLMTHEYAHLLGMWDDGGAESMLSHNITNRIPDPYCSRSWKG